MFGYIRKDKVIKIIKQGIEDLNRKEFDIIINTKLCKTEQDKFDFLESINKLKGGKYFLELLINKINNN